MYLHSPAASPSPHFAASKLFSLVGGVARAVLESAADDQVTIAELEATLNSALTPQRIINAAAQPGRLDQFSGKLLHLVNAPPAAASSAAPSFRTWAVIFASPYVENRLFKMLDSNAMCGLEALVVGLGAQPGLGAARGEVFEKWAHKQVVNGGRFPLRWLTDDPPTSPPEGDPIGVRWSATELVLEARISTLFGGKDTSSLADVARSNGCYGQPHVSNFASVDSVLTLSPQSPADCIMFQFTVFHCHPVGESGLVTVLEAYRGPSASAAAEAQLRPAILLFGVFDENKFNEFTAQNYLDGDRKKMLKLPPHLKSIAQGVILMMDSRIGA